MIKLSIFLKCDHSFEYNDLLFHILTDHYRSSTEYVRELLSIYIKDNKQAVEIISAEFLGHKGLSVDDYIEYIPKPFNCGDVLALHLLARMGNIQIAVIGCTSILYTHTTKL